MFKLADVWKAYSDDRHNAFTDIAEFKGRYYLVFRNGETHGSHDGRIFLLVSDDLRTWRRRTVFETKHDDRDPKLLSTNDRLICYIASRIKNPEHPRNKQCNLTWTEDGEQWSPIQPAYAEDHRFWRPRQCGDAYYVASCEVQPPERDEDWHVYLLKSSDGIEWREVSEIYSGDWANETSIVFPDEKRIVALVRREWKSGIPAVCVSSFPFTSWQCTDCDRFLQGPGMVVWGDDIIVVGRGKSEGRIRTVLYTLEDSELKEHLVLPSGGDTSYAGFLQTSPEELIVSYYSSHEGQAAIYIARIQRQ